MIRVACPNCQRTFRTTTEAMGRTAVCSGCHESFRIGSARPPFTWKPTDLGEDSWIGVEAPAEKKEIKHCIMCDAPLEDDAIRCLACGANQVTGLVHKPRNRPVAEVKAPVWSLLPIKTLIVVALVVLAGGGLFWGVRSIFSAAVEDGVEMAQVRVINTAARALAAGMDPDEFARKYAGRVDDKNLPRVLEMLDAGDVAIRNAAAPLIACGTVSDVAPIVAKAKSAHTRVADGAIKALQAIGPQRLVELSSSEQSSLRRPAAEALCLVFEIEANETTLSELSRACPVAEKIESLNKLCRPWPRAVGRFSVRIGEHVAPVAARVDQVGRTFYLQIGSGRFASDFDAERRFTIPVERWCAATGVAVDRMKMREKIGGTIILASPYGAGWQGEARVTARQKLTAAPPGFLPIASLDQDQTVSLPIVLEQR